MIWVLGFGFLMMTVLVVFAINELDDARLENKLLKQEIKWLHDNTNKE